MKLENFIFYFILILKFGNSNTESLIDDNYFKSFVIYLFGSKSILSSYEKIKSEHVSTFLYLIFH